jgi:hypothetical protein
LKRGRDCSLASGWLSMREFLDVASIRWPVQLDDVSESR